MTTLIAKTRLKFGSKSGPGGPIGLTVFEPGKTIEPGETFEADAETAKQLLADGSAMTPADVQGQARMVRGRGEAEERLRRAVDAGRAAGLDVQVSVATVEAAKTGRRS